MVDDVIYDRRIKSSAKEANQTNGGYSGIEFASAPRVSFKSMLRQTAGQNALQSTSFMIVTGENTRIAQSINAMFRFDNENDLVLAANTYVCIQRCVYLKNVEVGLFISCKLPY